MILLCVDFNVSIDAPILSDRLCDYEHVADPIRQLLPKDASILVPGCGNAVFSKDMYVFGDIYSVSSFSHC